MAFHIQLEANHTILYNNTVPLKPLNMLYHNQLSPKELETLLDQIEKIEQARAKNKNVEAKENPVKNIIKTIIGKIRGRGDKQLQEYYGFVD